MPEFYVRTPAEATEDEQAAFFRLVPAGGAMTEPAVRAGLPRAEALVICREDGKVVGVAALKVPQSRYREGLESAAKSGFALPEARYPRELGYVAVDEAYRGRGIGPRLCGEVMQIAQGRGVFATVGNDYSRTGLLPRLGFRDVGTSWMGQREQVFLMVCEPPRSQ